jgi:tripartite-type tricarboxylate transporter receptor subunit TctC
MKKTNIALGLALAVQAALAGAQSWPEKPIRLVIGFPPGGGADAVARPVAEALSRELGQPVIV